MGTEVKPHIKAADKITAPFIRSAKEQGYSILGTGGSMMTEVKYISVSFVDYGEYNIEQTRKKFLHLVAPFVNEIGSTTELKQYLVEPDAPERAANISITYRNQTNQQPFPPYIANVMMFNGVISYSVSDNSMTAYRDIYEETYQEALQKLHCSNN
jgi:hypothetical protein